MVGNTLFVHGAVDKANVGFVPLGNEDAIQVCHHFDKSFGVIQGTFSVIQGTFDAIQGTFGEIQGTIRRDFENIRRNLWYIRRDSDDDDDELRHAGVYTGSDVLLVTERVYSHCLTIYRSPVEHISKC